MEVDNQIAKLLVELSRSQDHEIGDGTTVCFCPASLSSCRLLQAYLHTSGSDGLGSLKGRSGFCGKIGSSGDAPGGGGWEGAGALGRRFCIAAEHSMNHLDVLAGASTPCGVQLDSQ